MRTRFVLLLLFVFALIFSAVPVFAGSISVTDFDDAGLNCTLREAIALANSVAVGPSIGPNGCSGATAGLNTINLPAGTYRINSQLPNIISEITIQRSGGGTVIIQANDNPNVATYRIFRAVSGAVFTLDNVTLRNGGSDSYAFNGGCISSEQSSLTILNSVIDDCHTSTSGGAVSALDVSLTITNSTISDSSSGATGGGISARRLVAILNGVVISGNTVTAASQGTGGGMYFLSTGGDITVTNSSFLNNTLQSNDQYSYGGGLSISGGGGTISGSVFSGNQASGVPTASYGGGLLFGGVSGLSITNSRFETNTAETDGNAIYNGSNAIITITSSCITNNGDTAVVDAFFSGGYVDATGGGNINNSNWWGTSWGPRIPALASTTGSYVSNGDSINGNGNTLASGVLVDVNLSSAGDYSTAPTGAWLTTAPTVAGATCQTCSSVSGGGEPRACY